MFHRVQEGQKRYLGVNWEASSKRWSVSLVIPLFFPVKRSYYDFRWGYVVRGWCVYCFYFRISRSIHRKFHVRATTNYYELGQSEIVET